MSKLGWLLGLTAAISTECASAATTLTYEPGSTVKLYQVNGDCDWVEWDATINQPHPTFKPTAILTSTWVEILGDDLPIIFEHNGEMIITFGDTFGANANRAKWTTHRNTYRWQAGDPIGRSTSTTHPLKIDFFMNGDHALEVTPPGIEMGADDVPSAGISVGGHIYLAVTTGTTSLGKGQGHDRSGDKSVLAEFDEGHQTFLTGRVLSQPGGLFTRPAFHYGGDTSAVWVFGIGVKDKSGVNLSSIPAGSFWSGQGARYFKARNGDTPIWSSSEADAKPVVAAPFSTNDVPYFAVSYVQQLGLWVMILDQAGGGQNGGMYLTYANQPWGPWSKPQLIFNPCRDNAFGRFMFYYYKTKADNDCPSALPKNVSAPTDHGSSGPAGPTAGNQKKNIYDATRGIAYSPAIVDRFTTIQDGVLKLYYMISTWNPYAVVMMESGFRLSCTGTDSSSCFPHGPPVIHGPFRQPGQPLRSTSGRTDVPQDVAGRRRLREAPAGLHRHSASPRHR